MYWVWNYRGQHVSLREPTLAAIRELRRLGAKLICDGTDYYNVAKIVDAFKCRQHVRRIRGKHVSYLEAM